MISIPMCRALKEFELEEGTSIVDVMHQLEQDITKVRWRLIRFMKFSLQSGSDSLQRVPMYP